MRTLRSFVGEAESPSPVGDAGSRLEVVLAAVEDASGAPHPHLAIFAQGGVGATLASTVLTQVSFDSGVFEVIYQAPAGDGGSSLVEARVRVRVGGERDGVSATAVVNAFVGFWADGSLPAPEAGGAGGDGGDSAFMLGRFRSALKENAGSRSAGEEGAAPSEGSAPGGPRTRSPPDAKDPPAFPGGPQLEMVAAEALTRILSAAANFRHARGSMTRADFKRLYLCEIVNGVAQDFAVALGVPFIGLGTAFLPDGSPRPVTNPDAATRALLPTLGPLVPQPSTPQHGGGGGDAGGHAGGSSADGASAHAAGSRRGARGSGKQSARRGGGGGDPSAAAAATRGGSGGARMSPVPGGATANPLGGPSGDDTSAYPHPRGGDASVGAVGAPSGGVPHPTALVAPAAHGVPRAPHAGFAAAMAAVTAASQVYGGSATAAGLEHAAAMARFHEENSRLRAAMLHMTQQVAAAGHMHHHPAAHQQHQQQQPHHGFAAAGGDAGGAGY